MMDGDIVLATCADEMPVVRSLFREYGQALGFDLGFQNFEQELAGLPGRYAEPLGCILLAKMRGEPVGCVGLRPLGDTVCEMKRLFVRPAARGTGLGRALAIRIIEEGRRRGYAAMRLDTVPAMMGKAVALYRELGFVRIPPYCDNPVAGAEFMELTLRRGDLSRR